MSTLKIFEKKRLRVCYWNAERRIVDSEKMLLEGKLKLLGDVDFVELSSLDDKNFNPCDLLIIAATNVMHEGFGKWLAALKKRIQQQGKIWTPGLILANVPFDILDELLLEAVQSNWYFDILDIRHVDSLPIRLANLLRIHDHLHELHRYSERLDELQGEVDTLQKKYDKLESEA